MKRFIQSLFLFALILCDTITRVQSSCKENETVDPYAPHPPPTQRVFEYTPIDISPDVCSFHVQFFLRY